VVHAVGTADFAVTPGQRVYINPATGCGSCRACRNCDLLNCRSFTYRGYFGRGPDTPRIFKQYPYGGLSEYVTAPQASLVTLPDNVSYEAAARFGYLGTGYGALRKAGFEEGGTVLINGIGGTLGLNTAMMALAMGAAHILGTGRRTALLERVKALAPGRIEVLSITEKSQQIRDWAYSLTEGAGVDVMIDALPPKSSPESTMAALRAVRSGGTGVLPGGMTDALTLDPNWLLSNNTRLMGSRWFTVAEGQRMADLASVGLLDLSPLEHQRFPLAAVNDAISAAESSGSGFTNVVVMP
jgi:alcohol dehydrogenase